MSKLTELAWDIEQLYIEGKNVGQIADELNCTKNLVLDWITDVGLKPFYGDAEFVGVNNE
jgi:orotate phosphoribosyltransferase-like protein